MWYFGTNCCKEIPFSSVHHPQGSEVRARYWVRACLNTGPQNYATLWTTEEIYLALALSSKSVHLFARLWSCVWIFSRSCVSAVDAILSPSARIMSTVGLRSSSNLWSSWNEKCTQVLVEFTCKRVHFIHWLWTWWHCDQIRQQISWTCVDSDTCKKMDHSEAILQVKPL